MVPLATVVGAPKELAPPLTSSRVVILIVPAFIVVVPV
jgi:hypothetical protein